DIEQPRGRVLRELRDDGRKGTVRIEVVEGMPAAARRLRQARKAFVERLPGAERRQARGPLLAQGFVEVGSRLVADVAGEVEIDPGHLVVEQELPEPAEMEALVAAPDDMQAEPGLEQYASGVCRQARRLGEFVDRGAAIAVGGSDGSQDAPVTQHRTGLEGERCDREALGGLERRQG